MVKARFEHISGLRADCSMTLAFVLKKLDELQPISCAHGVQRALNATFQLGNLCVRSP